MLGVNLIFRCFIFFIGYIDYIYDLKTDREFFVLYLFVLRFCVGLYWDVIGLSEDK